MVDDDARTTIRPTARVLPRADLTLFERIRYIRHVLGCHDPGEIVDNAAIIYLVMSTAFRDAKFLGLDWVPSLPLNIEDQKIEMVISHVISVLAF
jgi:hypothetical protein